MKAQDENLLISPISVASPCGTLVIYDEDYEAVQIQIAYLASPDPSVISWRKVVEHCEFILREKSKDLTVACYWSIAQLEIEGISSFSRSVEFLTSFISLYWEDMYPDKKRLRGRINALSWWLDRIEFRTSNISSETTTSAGVQQAIKSLKKFELVLGTKLSESLIKFSTVFQGLVDLSKVIGVSENSANLVLTHLDNTFDAISMEGSERVALNNETKTVVRVKNSTKALEPKCDAIPIVNAASNSMELKSEGDVTQFLRERQQELLQVSKFLFDRSNRDPRAYYLNRIGSWLTVKSSPVHRGDGVTPFKAVPAEQQTKIVTLWNNKEYEQVVSLCEELFPFYPYYLDLHRYSALSLMYMGDEYKQAMDVVEVELRGFLIRFPEIKKLMFKNGESFAGKETLKWIANQVTVHDIKPVCAKNSETRGGQQNVVLPIKNMGNIDKIEKVKTDLPNVIAGTCSFNEKIFAFQTAILRVNTNREKFLMKLSRAEFCYEEGKYEIAISQLQHLGEHSERFFLEYWEQGLVVKMISLHLRSYISLLSSDHVFEKDDYSGMDDLYHKLCQLDLVEATKFDTKMWRTPALQ